MGRGCRRGILSGECGEIVLGEEGKIGVSV